MAGGSGARLCLQDQPQRVVDLNAFGLFPLLRLVLRTQPRSETRMQPVLGL